MKMSEVERSLDAGCCPTIHIGKDHTRIFVGDTIHCAISLVEMEKFISTGAIELEEGEIVCIRSGKQAEDFSEDVSLYEFYQGRLRFQSGCLANPPI